MPRLRLATTLLLAPLLGAAAPVPDAPITGSWTPIGSECTVTDGAIRITARLLIADEIACRFETAPPSGRRNPWVGGCADLDGSGSSAVSIVRHGAQIRIAFDGGPAVAYRRCRSK